jgi:hypothetical protein
VAKILRVHELAKELGMSNQETLDLCAEMGIGVKTQSSTIIDQQAARVRTRVSRDRITSNHELIVEDSGISFFRLADELGLKKAEMIEHCTKAGLYIYGVLLPNVIIPNDKAEKIRKSAKKNKPGSKKSKTTLQKLGVDSAIDQTLEQIAETFGITAIEILDLCLHSGFPIASVSDSLTKRQRLKLMEILLKSDVDSFNNNQNVGGNEIKSLVEKALKEPQKPQKKVPSKKITDKILPSNAKRVALLSRDLGVDAVEIEWICNACRVPLVGGKKASFDIKYEERIRRAWEIWTEIRVLRSDISDVRISKLAKRLKIELKEVKQACNKVGIAIKQERFISVEDELLLLVALKFGESTGLYEYSTMASSSKFPVPPKPGNLVPKDDVGGTPLSGGINPLREAQSYRNVDLTRQKITDFSFEGCDMVDVNLSYSDISESDFSNAIMKQSRLIRVVGIATIFRGTDLSATTADFADFTGSDFSGANLRGGSFRRVDFSHAVLSGADLSECDLTGAIMTEANLDGAIFENTRGLGSRKITTETSMIDIKESI